MRKLKKLLKGGQTRNLLNLEKKIKSLVEDDKIDEDLVQRRRINKGKSKINEITTVPVDLSSGQDEDTYTKESRDYTIYNILKMSIKRQKEYKTAKVTVKWAQDMGEAMNKTHIELNLRHKDRIIRTCWYIGSLKLKDIKEYMKYKLYRNVEDQIKEKDNLEICRLYQEKHRLYHARIIEVGGKPYLEATFPSKNFQDEIEKNMEIDNKDVDVTSELNKPVELVTQKVNDDIEIIKDSKEVDGIKEQFKFKAIERNHNLDRARLLIENDNDEGLIYIEGHFKCREDVIKALNTPPLFALDKPWQEWLETKSINTTHQTRIRDRLSDEEIKVLNEELERVNESCSGRLEKINVEDKDPDENNKRKKTRSDTTYRAKFGAKALNDRD
ncbi:hypothetical protein RCL_jg3970.t1 [Rhizophagus clarus]|uniref:Uncharacterized protein n=1 Tax=Rhizophagus clarus TaxID=94130 RepID=A0A8H3QAJ0_9GLOM|nr:hypothetical protein RCL_jg3970.t1 [Rhizophagus clarus]